MHFTTMNSFKEIMDWHGMRDWMRFLFMEEPMSFFNKEYEDIPLRASAFLGKTSWEDDLRAVSEQLVDTANIVLDIQEGRRKCLHLRDWTDWEPNENSKLTDPDNIFVITPILRDIDKHDKKPAMVICPGGAYEFVSFQNEGTPVLMLAELNGYQGFMINYRAAQNAAYPNPQMDLLETIAYIRENAEKFGVDEKRIAAVGFSAGGHLVGSAAGVADELLPSGKPNAVVLGYPVISLKDGVTHEQSRYNLIERTKNKDIDKTYEELRDKLSVEELADKNYPPAFIWACEDDDCVPPVNTKLMGEALEKSGVLNEWHLYPTGGHGCGLAFGNSAYTWSESMLKFLKKAFMS